MAYVGAVGIITSFPNCGEKHCVACDHWTGGRDIGYNGTAATSRSGAESFCALKKNNTFIDYAGTSSTTNSNNANK